MRGKDRSEIDLILDFVSMEPLVSIAHPEEKCSNCIASIHEDVEYDHKIKISEIGHKFQPPLIHSETSTCILLHLLQQIGWRCQMNTFGGIHLIKKRIPICGVLEFLNDLQ